LIFFRRYAKTVSAMITELLLASNNAHKKTEIAQALPGYTLLLPRDKNIRFECEETGTTFVENALLKARALFALCRSPVLADDSGLCVSALGGSPGVVSARFGSELPSPPRDDRERNAYLLSLLPRAQKHEAFFVCAMVVMFDEHRFACVQETVQGLIIDSPAGELGFGYDPVFFVPELGKTVAQIPLALKNSFSHRGRAAARIRLLLDRERAGG
jgi:XTP/dITP diphosphohydrolase